MCIRDRVEDLLNAVTGDGVLHGWWCLRGVLVLGANTGGGAPGRPCGVDDLVGPGSARVCCLDGVVAAGLEGADGVEHSGNVAATRDCLTGCTPGEQWQGEESADG